MSKLNRNVRVFWALIGVFCAMSAAAQSSPLGLWVAYDDDGLKPQALVRISEQQGKLSGQIVEILDTDVAPDERCDKCPADRKGQPIRGLQIIRQVDAMPRGGVWMGGLILDPDDGREYRLEINWVPGSKELKLRGYWGPFWRTQTWRRPAGSDG